MTTTLKTNETRKNRRTSKLSCTLYNHKPKENKKIFSIFIYKIHIHSIYAKKVYFLNSETCQLKYTQQLLTLQHPKRKPELFLSIFLPSSPTLISSGLLQSLKIFFVFTSTARLTNRSEVTVGSRAFCFGSRNL